MHTTRRSRAAFTPRAHAAEGRALPTSFDDTQPAPVSAARLAAEALFGGHRAPPPHSPVQVVVLRKRGFEPPAPPSGAGPTEPPAGDGRNERAPRVFTLRPQAPRVEAGAAQADDAAATPQVAVRRRRRARHDRIGHDTRARVVRLLLLPPPADTRPDEPAAPDTTRPPGGAAELRRRLAAVDLTLDAIRQASAFTLRDDAVDAEWSRLASAIDELARALRAPLAQG